MGPIFSACQLNVQPAETTPYDVFPPSRISTFKSAPWSKSLTKRKNGDHWRTKTKSRSQSISGASEAKGSPAVGHNCQQSSRRLEALQMPEILYRTCPFPEIRVGRPKFDDPTARKFPGQARNLFTRLLLCHALSNRGFCVPRRGRVFEETWSMVIWCKLHFFFFFSPLLKYVFFLGGEKVQEIKSERERERKCG